MELTGLDLGLLPGLCAPKQVDKAFLQVGSSDWDVTLEAVIFSGGPWWLLQRGRKTELSVGSLAVVVFPAHTPTLLRAPPHPWVLRELPFLVPLLQAPHGPGHWVCMALRSFFCSGSGHPCCAHTSPHDIQGLPFSASLSCPCAWRPCPSVPSPEALQLLLSLTGPGETWRFGACVAFPPVSEEAPVGALSPWASGP